MQVELKVNKAYRPYLKSTNRYEIFYGGSGSGKSHFVAQKMVLNHIREAGRKTLVVRKVGRTIRHSCFSLIREVIASTGLEKHFNIPKGKTEFDITCFNGNQFIFTGLDDVEKLKSIVGVTDIWVEEATEITQDDFTQIDLRLRGESRHPKQIILTYNPVSALSWLKRYFHDAPSENISILRTTYKDNAFIDDEYRNVLESLEQKDPTYYKIYALGEWGVLGNLILSNYEVSDFDNNTDNFTVYQGLDFGFNDPSAFVKVGVRDDEIYILDELYLKGLTNIELLGYVEQMTDRKISIIADSSEPDRIKEFRQKGFNMRAAEKGPGSIKAGLDFIKRRKINIHPSCSNFLKEIQGYKYREDKDGNVYDEPVDMNNHLMDALRYALEDMRKNRKLSVGKSIY